MGKSSQQQNQKGNAGSSASGNAASAAPAAVKCQRVCREPNSAVVLAPDDSKFLTIELNFTLPPSPTAEPSESSPIVVSKSMSREADGPVAKTVERMRLLMSAPSQKKRNKEELLQACPPVKLLGKDAKTEIDMDVSNKEAWPLVAALRIGDDFVVPLAYNPATVVTVVPPRNAYVGLPVVCADITTLFTDGESVRYEWFLCKDGKETAMTPLSTEPAVVPTAEHVGKTFLLRVAASPDSPLYTQVTLPPVQPPPPPMERWRLTAERPEGGAFRVVTYNILYDDFCTSKHSRRFIYPFATDEMLDGERRLVRTLQELLAYRGDLVALQECGKKAFKTYLLPSLRTCGFDGFYTNKSGSVQEGHCLFFRSERFSLVSEPTRLALNGTLLRERFPELAARVSEHREFADALDHLTTTGTVAVLHDKLRGGDVVVGNTHFFYHANACHIRILQAYMFMSALRDAAKTPGAADVSKPIVFCGDCNFTHSTGAYRLVTTGQLEAAHHSWEKGKLFWWGCDRQLGYSEEELAAADLPSGAPPAPETATKTGNPTEESANSNSQRAPLETFFAEEIATGLPLADAYDRTDPSMPWTNYTMTFKEVIDYIFFSPKTLQVRQTVPIPPESELNSNFAIPNAMYPSDHVALIADIDYL